MSDLKFKLFEDKKEVERLTKHREELIEDLSKFDILDIEKRLIIRKINIITGKLLNNARYGK